MLLQSEDGYKLSYSTHLGVVDEAERTELATISIMVDGDDIRILVQRLQDDPTVVFTVV